MVIQVWEQLHHPLVDLFVMDVNAVLPQYFSPVPDPLALGMDTLFHSWEGLDACVRIPPVKSASGSGSQVEVQGRRPKMGQARLVPLPLPDV